MKKKKEIKQARKHNDFHHSSDTGHLKYTIARFSFKQFQHSAATAPLAYADFDLHPFACELLFGHTMLCIVSMRWWLSQKKPSKNEEPILWKAMVREITERMRQSGHNVMELGKKA